MILKAIREDYNKPSHKGSFEDYLNSQDGMGFAWFEIFKDGKSTGKSFSASNKEDAIKMYLQFYG